MHFLLRNGWVYVDTHESLAVLQGLNESTIFRMYYWWMNECCDEASGHKYAGNSEIRYGYDTISQSVCYLGFGGLGVWRERVWMARAFECWMCELQRWIDDFDDGRHASSRRGCCHGRLGAAGTNGRGRRCLQRCRWARRAASSAAGGKFFLNLQTFESIFDPASIILCPLCLHYDFKFLWLCFFLIFVNGVAMKVAVSPSRNA